MAPHTPKPTLLPPPGPIVQQYHLLPTGAVSPINSNPNPSSSPYPPLPPLFLSALTVRYNVFSLGQGCNPALEIDADDAVSWHWVICAVGGDWKQGERGACGYDTLGACPVPHACGWSG
ncbi:hypothetical protein N7G274_008409 [Stereocaulon virgatum]|uniref:Uncharacterized protein n=1 Tax=Stereocaulon virgatum TaxID=373712 RepID=A0ABR3ZYW9_9LECA